MELWRRLKIGCRARMGEATNLTADLLASPEMFMKGVSMIKWKSFFKGIFSIDPSDFPKSFNFQHAPTAIIGKNEA